MTSSTGGAATSLVEVTNVDRFGVWLLVDGKEYFLPYDEYPWFRRAPLEDILTVERLHDEHLHWPALDVDLSISSLERPEDFPLVYR
jgi:hypothetical protein